jgi:hypothetical protein
VPKSNIILSTTFALAVSCITTAEIGHAQSLENSIVTLAEGSWSYQQKTFINGQEIVPARLSERNCVTEAQAQMSISQYIQKASQGFGKDVTCNLSPVRGTVGNVQIDLQCSNAHATTSLALNYTYSLTAMSLTGTGHTKVDGVSMPIRITGNSQHTGPC